MFGAWVLQYLERIYPLVCGADSVLGQRASMEQTGWRELGRLLGRRFGRELDREPDRELWYDTVVSKPHGSWGRPQTAVRADPTKVAWRKLKGTGAGRAAGE